MPKINISNEHRNRLEGMAQRYNEESASRDIPFSTETCLEQILEDFFVRADHQARSNRAQSLEGFAARKLKY